MQTAMIHKLYGVIHYIEQSLLEQIYSANSQDGRKSSCWNKMTSWSTCSQILWCCKAIWISVGVLAYTTEECNGYHISEKWRVSDEFSVGSSYTLTAGYELLQWTFCRHLFDTCVNFVWFSLKVFLPCNVCIIDFWCRFFETGKQTVTGIPSWSKN